MVRKLLFPQWSFAFFFALAPAAFPNTKATAQSASALDGVWEVTALIDDGEALSATVIRETLVRDARITINGQSITLVRPGSEERRKLLFISDPKADPAVIDLAGSEHTGSKGIYIQAGDTLMICLGGPGIDRRPKEFSSKTGSSQMLMTLKRIAPLTKTTAPAPVSSPAPALAPAPTPPPKKVKDEDLRKMLIGSWGHSTRDYNDYITLNSDGTFGNRRDYKRTFQQIFDMKRITSGTWKVLDGSIVMSITASSERKLIGQILSYRISSMSATDVIYFDQEGNVRREWKIR